MLLILTKHDSFHLPLCSGEFVSEEQAVRSNDVRRFFMDQKHFSALFDKVMERIDHACKQCNTVGVK